MNFTKNNNCRSWVATIDRCRSRPCPTKNEKLPYPYRFGSFPFYPFFFLDSRRHDSKLNGLVLRYLVNMQARGVAEIILFQELFLLLSRIKITNKLYIWNTNAYILIVCRNNTNEDHITLKSGKKIQQSNSVYSYSQAMGALIYLELDQILHIVLDFYPVIQLCCQI